MQLRAHLASHSKRSLPAAIALKQLLLHRLEQLLPTTNHNSLFETPQSCNAINIDTGREANYQELRKNSEGDEWTQMMSDELGKCSQGNDAHPNSGTNTFFWITHDQVPADKKATYARIVAEDRPHKAVTKRICLTVGGNRIEAQARSPVAGHFILSDALPDPANALKPATAPPPHNGAILIISSILPMVLASATEAELAALYYNAREACTIRTTLTEMGHPQLPTPIQTDNEVAVSLALNKVKQ